MPINFNLSKYLNPIYIETGTLYGNSAIKAVEAGFEKIYTIEIHTKYFKISKNNLTPYIEEGKVVLILGDSKEVLPIILEKINKKITIFLDAHWHRQRKGMDCAPLYKELEILKLYPEFLDTIMIDDKRMLGRKSWGKTIEYDKVIQILKEINSSFNITYEKGIVEDDIIAATLKEE